MRGHDVVTLERQGGYAARCEVEVDGEIHICGITFGGFRTRSQARNALTHEYAPDLAAATAVEGEIQETNNQKENQTMTIVSPRTDILTKYATFAAAKDRSISALAEVGAQILDNLDVADWIDDGQEHIDECMAAAAALDKARAELDPAGEGIPPLEELLDPVRLHGIAEYLRHLAFAIELDRSL